MKAGERTAVLAQRVQRSDLLNVQKENGVQGRRMQGRSQIMTKALVTLLTRKDDFENIR